MDAQKWKHAIAFGFHREIYGEMCLVKRIQEVRCCFYICHDGERIINIPSIEEGSLPSRSRFSSIEDMNTLASKGPRGEPIATPSVCSYRAPLNWNRCPFVATLRRSTRSVLVRLKPYVELNGQLLVKALFASISIVSFKVTLANRYFQTSKVSNLK